MFIKHEENSQNIVSTRNAGYKLYLPLISLDINNSKINMFPPCIEISEKKKPLITWVQADSKAGWRMWKLHSGIKGRFQVCPDWRLLAWEAEGELSRGGISSVSGRGVHIWLALISSKLEARIKIRELGSYQSSPSHCGLFVKKVTVQLSGL